MDESRVKMTIQRPNPEKTTVYSKNECVQCKMTKNELNKIGIPYDEINIEESPYMNEYIAFIKNGESGPMAMPYVVPPVLLHMEPFAGFRPQMIKEMATKLQLK